MTQIEQTELEKITELRRKFATVVSEAGNVSLQIGKLKSDIVILEEALNTSVKQFDQLLKEEQILVTQLTEKYGTGSINFEDGTITAA